MFVFNPFSPFRALCAFLCLTPVAFAQEAMEEGEPATCYGHRPRLTGNKGGSQEAAPEVPVTATLTLSGITQGVVGQVVPADPAATALQNVAVPTAETWRFSLQQAGAQIGLKVEHRAFFWSLDSSAMFGGLGKTTNGVQVLQTLSSTLGGTAGYWTLSVQGGLFGNQRGFEPVLPSSASQQWFVAHATPTYEWAYWNLGAEVVAAHTSGNAVALGYSGTWDGVARFKPSEQQPTVYAGFRVSRNWGSASAHITAAPTAGPTATGVYDVDTAGEVVVSENAALRWQANVAVSPGSSATTCGFFAGRFGGPVRLLGDVRTSVRIDGCGEFLQPGTAPFLLDAAGPATTLYRMAGTAGFMVEPWQGVRLGIEGTGGFTTSRQLFGGMYGTFTVFGTAKNVQ